MNDNSFAFSIIKRLFICIIVLIVMLFASNLAWLYAWMQYDYETVDVEQSSTSEGDCNYIGEEGDISYGLSEGTYNEENEE